MKEKQKKFYNIFNRNLKSDSKDFMANLYSVRCYFFCLLADTFCLILNLTGIFVVDQKIFVTSYLMVLALSIIFMILLMTLGLEHSGTKYVCVIVFCVLTTIAGITLTYHTLILITIPIVLAGLYSNKKLPLFAYLMALVTIFLSVYIGYYVGVCDANMALITTNRLSYYCKDGIFLARKVNDNVVVTLGLYYVLPRTLSITAFYVISRNVRAIIQQNATKAVKMEILAVTDKMTGVYNKSKLLDDLQNRIYQHEMVAVLYWDVNHLKYVNDHYGHIIGDHMITEVSNTIKEISDDHASVYRYGGDEFLMIIQNGTKEDALQRIEKWKREMKQIHMKIDIPVSASVGYAIGSGAEIEEVIRQADQSMYQDKIKNHQNRREE